MHVYDYIFEPDGDYIVWRKWVPTIHNRGYWVEFTRWLIPGTQLED